MGGIVGRQWNCKRRKGVREERTGIHDVAEKSIGSNKRAEVKEQQN